MDSDDMWSAFFISISLFTFVVFFVALAYKTLQERGSVDLVSKRCITSLLCCQRHKQSELDIKVESLERRLSIEFNRRTVRSFSPTAAVVLYIVMMIKVFDWTSDKMMPLKDGHVACVVGCLVVSIICVIFDNQPSETLSYILHISVMGRLAWIQASYLNVFAAFTDKQYVLMLRLAVSVMMSKDRLIYATNLFLTGVSIGTMWYHMENDEKFARVYDEEIFFANIVIQEFVAFVFVLVVCRSFYQQRLNEARATVDADMSQNLFGAASRLSSMMYDVVVEIDEARRVIGQATNLAGMLFHGTNRSLEGKCLVDFILPGKDRRLFEDMLSSSGSAPTKLRLKGTAGTVLHVEMFHARYNNIEKLAHHMIGIRELETQAVAPALSRHRHLTPLLELDQAAEASRVARVVPQQGTRAQIAAADIGETRLSAESASSRKSRSETSARPLLLPERKETSCKARNESMMSTLARWNVQVPVVHCCSYHAALLASRDTLRHLQNLCCREFRGMCLPWQCPQCGLLSEDADSAKYIDGEGCLTCTKRCYGGSSESMQSTSAKVSL